MQEAHVRPKRERALGVEKARTKGWAGESQVPSRALQSECPFVCNEIESTLLESMPAAKLPGKKSTIDALLGKNSLSPVGHEPSYREAWFEGGWILPLHQMGFLTEASLGVARMAKVSHLDFRLWFRMVSSIKSVSLGQGLSSLCPRSSYQQAAKGANSHAESILLPWDYWV